MGLNVDMEILVDNHFHRGASTPKGTVVSVNPNRAARMLASGIGKKVGVSEPESEAVSTQVDAEPDDDVEDVEEVDEDED